MKFVVSIQFIYEVTDDELRDCYGTNNPEDAAKVDQENFKADPGTIHSLMETEEFMVTVRPA